MGADMTLAGCPAPVDRNEQPITTATPEFIAMVKERVRSLEPNFITNFIVTPEDGLDESIDAIVAAIAALVNEWRDVRRDIAWRTIGEDPRLWLFSGGMTWGDDPSDSFSLLDFIDTFDLFTEPFDMDGGKD